MARIPSGSRSTTAGGHDFKLLMNKKVTAGLAGYIKSGELSDAGILVACRTLCSFRELAQNIGVDGMSVFGTAPLRNIVNTEEAVNTIKSVTGISIDVLSGADEAQLSYTGATWGGNVPLAGLLADIGGGSTELVSYADGKVIAGLQPACGLAFALYRIHLRPFSHKGRGAMRCATASSASLSAPACPAQGTCTSWASAVRYAPPPSCHSRLAGTEPGARLIPHRRGIGAL